MSSTSELVELQRLVGQLRSTVTSLRARHGESSELLRVSNDVERLNIDAADLTHGLPAPRAGARSRGSVLTESGGEVVFVPDTPHDPSLWHDADDEGVGGQARG